MRGKLPHVEGGDKYYRITPADAGKTMQLINESVYR